jgi:serine/threonine-protein kinase
MSAAPPVESVGDYVLECPLGRGAQGAVYLAHHHDRPETPVALKVVEGRGQRDRLLLEPALLSRLDHPGIVGLKDYFLRGDQLVLALEFVEGQDLQSLLDRGETFTEEDVRDLLVQLGSALAEAHGKNVLHRDIKPSNILVVRTAGRPRYVLTDFGIGQVAEGIQVRKHTGGTYLYMAPEQLRGRPCPQSDLWALGVVAYRLLTGRHPFPGPTPGELTNQVLYAAPLPPGECSPGPLDPRLESVVMKLLDKSLQERVASAEELLRLLGHRGPPDRPAAVRKGVPPGKTRPRLDRQLRQGIATRRVLLVLCVLGYLLPKGAGAGLLLLAAMALFYVAQKDERHGRAAVAAGTLLSFALLVGYLVLRYVAPSWDFYLSVPVYRLGRGLQDLAAGWFGVTLGPTVAPLIILVVVVVVPALVYLFLPVIGGALYVSMRRLQRELTLRNAALESGTDSDRYLQALRDALDSRFEDVGLHLKYAEALFARGRVKEAAVEARVLLRQDPYHFSANLLLANAYLGLGLWEDCVAVCDRYLAVSGYCFEFHELREQCRRRLVPS